VIVCSEDESRMLEYYDGAPGGLLFVPSSFLWMRRDRSRGEDTTIIQYVLYPLVTKPGQPVQNPAQYFIRENMLSPHKLIISQLHLLIEHGIRIISKAIKLSPRPTFTSLSTCVAQNFDLGHVFANRRWAFSSTNIW
jgi:hypothetical protein